MPATHMRISGFENESIDGWMNENNILVGCIVILTDIYYLSSNKNEYSILQSQSSNRNAIPLSLCLHDYIILPPGGQGGSTIRNSTINWISALDYQV